MKPTKPLIEHAPDVLRKYAEILSEAPVRRSLDPSDYRSYDEYARVLATTPLPQIVAYMDDFSQSGRTAIWPSSWRDLEWAEEAPYPGKLALALVKSTSNESITDLGNMYYSRRVLSSEAAEVFRRDAIATGKSSLIEFGMLNLWNLAKNEPNVMKQIILTMTPQELDQFEHAEEIHGAGRNSIKMLVKKLGIRK